MLKPNQIIRLRVHCEKIDKSLWNNPYKRSEWIKNKHWLECLNLIVDGDESLYNNTPLDTGE